MKTVELIPDINESALSEPAPTSQYTQDIRVTKHDCFNDCVLDSWEMKSEFLCASACGLDI